MANSFEGVRVDRNNIEQYESPLTRSLQLAKAGQLSLFGALNHVAEQVAEVIPQPDPIPAISK
ncbi:MAG TPA: hypothetical protein VF401_00260 [Candidatus Saccharimonadales bacterium]